jgi:fluoroacetyl-CoA thioesterase
MKASLQPGISKVKRIVVDRARTIGFMGEDGRVYSTPQLLGDIEQTCRELLLEHGDAGEDSVGMEVSLRHLAPTLVDMAVDIAVTITAIEGRKVSFEISAQDPIEPIAAGTHTRFVVDVGKTVQRLKAKAGKHAAVA